MAKIHLTYEDNPDGSVKVVLQPDARTLFARFKQGEKMSPAESMVIMDLLPAIAKAAKKEFEDRRIIIPGNFGRQ